MVEAVWSARFDEGFHDYWQENYPQYPTTYRELMNGRSFGGISYSGDSSPNTAIMRLSLMGVVSGTVQPGGPDYPSGGRRYAGQAVPGAGI